MRNKQITKESVHLLVACEDIALGKTLERFLNHTAITIDRCHDLAGLLRHVSRHAITILVLDLALGKDSNINLVSFVKERNPSTRMILLFEMEHIEEAIEGIRQGAFFYLPRSSAPSDIALAVSKALENRQAELHLDTYEQSVFEELVGHTDAMRRIIDLIRKVAPTNSTVLLLGESGTGKEVVAQTLHRLSARRDKPFVALNCAALPHALLESELFGHVRGAFTGAVRDARGLVESAQGGTLFLDEIGDLAMPLQAKLLRLLQEKTYQRVGEPKPQRADVRILAATNVDLEQALARGAFRQDLYFRLCVIPIRIPPLRDRPEDIAPLASFLLARRSVAAGRLPMRFSREAMRLLEEARWEGNVRQLINVVDYVVALCEPSLVEARSLPEEFLNARRAERERRVRYQVDERGEAEAALIRGTLASHGFHRQRTADALGMDRVTLYRKIREYRIELPGDRAEDETG